VRYKLLAVDVDGTLLRRDGTVHPADKDAIARLRGEGVPVTIATGRLYSGTRPVAVEVGLTGPIACVDGSHIVDLAGDRALFASPITGAHAITLRGVLTQRTLARFLFAQDTIIHDAEGHSFAGYVRLWSPNIDVVDRVVDHPFWEHEHGVMAIVAIGSEGEIMGAAEELRSSLEGAARVITFPVLRAERHAMIVRSAEPTKGTAIRWLADHYGCTASEVVVVGDWINDVPMFQTAGRSFVMGQAPDHVKAAATDHLVADAHGGGGVAEAIERAFGV
jgi:Cof subfamily protein (haloacid dehalogenase superfamily)